MNVLVIPEDQTHDHHILIPIVKGMMGEVGRPKARVQHCRNPAPRGVGHVLKRDFIDRVVDQNRQVNLFLLIVDRDGEEGRRQSLDHIESAFTSDRNLPGRILIAEAAWQEIEVWGLSVVHPRTGWVWNEVRAERDAKERYFANWAQQEGHDRGPGGGRQQLGQLAGGNYKRVRSLCPEVADLENRIKAWLDQRGAN